MTQTKISAFVICCNEERHIRRCLESIRWCDEIVVVDSGSTDRTLEICREFTPKIIHNPWPGHRAQKEFALGQCTEDWVLNIDADEEVTPELKEEILKTLSVPTELNGFELLRVVYYLGKFWRKGAWYPEFKLRLLRRRSTTWGGEDPHEKALVNGQVGRLKCELLHYTYSGLSDQVSSLNSHSSSSAQSMTRKGVKFNPLFVVLNPIARFFKLYVAKRGYREGFSGFLVATIDSFGVFLKYAKLWEKEQKIPDNQ